MNSDRFLWSIRHSYMATIVLMLERVPILAAAALKPFSSSSSISATSGASVRTPTTNTGESRTSSDSLRRPFRSILDSADLLDLQTYDDRNIRNGSSADEITATELFAEAPPSDSLSGIIIFSWCVVALFGFFFALLIAAHWQLERRNGGHPGGGGSSSRGAEKKAIGKSSLANSNKSSTSSKHSKPALLLPEEAIEFVDGASGKAVLEKKKSNSV